MTNYMLYITHTYIIAIILLRQMFVFTEWWGTDRCSHTDKSGRKTSWNTKPFSPTERCNERESLRIHKNGFFLFIFDFTFSKTQQNPTMINKRFTWSFDILVNQPSVWTATLAHSQMTAVDSLTWWRSASEGTTKYYIDKEHTGPSIDAIGPSTGSATRSATPIPPTIGTVDDTHDPASTAPAADSSGQNTDRGDHTAALGVSRTASR